MFTGIIDHCGTVLKLDEILTGKRIWIQSEFNDLVVGESIAVDGVCLTVVQSQAHQFCSDVSPETLELTRLGGLKQGNRINLERSLRLNDRLSGHIVQGHVDEVATLQEKKQLGNFWHYQFNGLGENVHKLLQKKGSVTVNGVSLTVNEIGEDGFEVMLIPQTLLLTNLADIQPCDKVNIEYDFMAKVIVNYISCELRKIESPRESSLLKNMKIAEACDSR